MEENWSIQLEDLREGRVREVELTRTLELDERMRGASRKRHSMQSDDQREDGGLA